MRATLNIPDDLLGEVQKFAREKSKTKAIVTAMEEYVRARKLESLTSLQGKLEIDYDFEREEERELALQEEREEYGKK
jgi:metal-responsive CopG/Arc/MetJ family transcriptional regulator